MRVFVAVLLFWLGAVVHADDALAPLPASLPTRYGVVGVRAHAVAGTLHVARVRLYSPAAACGLRSGDRILGASGYRLVSADELSRFVQSLAPEDSVVFHLQRGGLGFDARCRVTDRRRLFGLMTELQSPPPGSADRHDRWLATAEPTEKRARQLISRYSTDGVLDTLSEALQTELRRYGSDGRLADVDFVLQHPLKAAAAGVAIQQAFSPSQSLQSLLRAAAAHLDLPPAQTACQRGDAPASAGLPDLLLAPVQRAVCAVDLALADLSSTERDQLRRGVAPLLQRLDRSFYLDEGDSSETETHMLTLRLAKRVRVELLLQAAQELSWLASADAVERIAAETSRLSRWTGDLPPGVSGDILFAHKSDFGWIVVGDTTANVYTGQKTIIVDLGGDDTYLAGPGSASGNAGVGVVLDLSGNDRYVGNGVGSLGGGLLGVGLLVDRAGNDTYSGNALTQGAGFCGVGMLRDMAGDDVYLAQYSAQGAGFFGVGLLVDDAGDDLTSLGQFGQGFGGAHGAGLLLDGGGDDRYVADFKVPSSYGTVTADGDEVYSGWAQGVGMGFRGFTAGGLGLLSSAGDGDDTYQAGDFAQGTGYFLGLGVLADGGGSDTYTGSRYAQGAAAHQAVGILLDDDGADHYIGTVAAAQGAAWDAAVAVLVDRRGHDQYIGGDLAQGAAAMNGVGWLHDRAGNDTYQTRSGQGEGGSVRYWGGRGALNLGLLIDSGGRDSYNLPGRADGTDLRSSQVGLFRDVRRRVR